MLRHSEEMGKQVKAAPNRHVSLTGPDARSMATSGKGTGIAGYNVQMAVDAEHHLIVADEVTNIGSGRAQLTSMGQKALDATGCEEITVLADRGYYNGDEVLASRAAEFRAASPRHRRPATPSAAFSPCGLRLRTVDDRSTCPAGKHLTRGKVRSDRQDNIDTIAISRPVRPARSNPDA